MKRILAIDFGTTTTVFADTSVDDELEPKILEPTGNKIADSIVQIDPKSKRIEFVGNEAMKRIESAAERTSLEFKLGICTSKKYTIKSGNTKATLSAKDVSILFLQNLREKIENTTYNRAKIEDKFSITVIGFPVEWTEPQRDEIITIAQQAGFPNVIGCSEPKGALYYLHYKGVIDAQHIEDTVVYDFGGGTLDVCIATRNHAHDSEEPFAFPDMGSSSVGGKYFDDILFDYFSNEIRQITQHDLLIHERGSLRQCVRALKEKLSQKISEGEQECETTVPFLLTMHGAYTLRLSKIEFETLCADLIKESSIPLIQVLNTPNAKKLQHVIFTGGASQFYYLADMVHELSPTLNLIFDPTPQETIAKGLALYGKSKLSGKSFTRKSAPSLDGKVPTHDAQPPPAGNQPTPKGSRLWWGIGLAVCILLVYWLFKDDAPNTSVPNTSVPQASVPNTSASKMNNAEVQRLKDENERLRREEQRRITEENRKRAYENCLNNLGLWDKWKYGGFTTPEEERCARIKP